MFSCRLLFLAVAVSLIACDDKRQTPPNRAARGSSRARSGAEDVGRKTEHAFRHVGGHLEKFFTGHDTISR
ncbi:MAG: hypothetical protein ABIP20_14920 [Chthoniobacteraceae bacterium]